MAEVELSHVDKSYDKTAIIEDLDLAVRDEEFMVLVGPSGCGKSTALRMIAGLEEVTAGEIRIGGKRVNDVAPKDRDIAMVFQSYALYPHMTVRQNLEFGLKVRGIARPQIDQRVKEAAQLLDISGLLERKPRELSGGQRQRVAVGRAIVRKPAVFLFDEPLSNLDAKLRVQMRAELSKLQQRLRTTTIYVTHDQVEAMTMGHRVAVLKQGRLQQVGEPLEVYERPANVFVANFIGTPPMNFFTAAVRDERLEAAAFSLPAPEAWRGALAGRHGGRVVVGIRPEHVHEAGKPLGGPTARLPLVVEAVESLGHEVVLHGRAGSDLLVAKLHAARAPQVGSVVDVDVELDALHLFDPETERRL